MNPTVPHAIKVHCITFFFANVSLLLPVHLKSNHHTLLCFVPQFSTSSQCRQPVSTVKQIIILTNDCHLVLLLCLLNQPTPPVILVYCQEEPHCSYCCPFLFCWTKTASSRFGPGRSLADDERPIITGHSDKEAWVTELQNYVTTMKERYLDAEHPPVEWLSASLPVSQRFCWIRDGRPLQLLRKVA